MAQNRELINDCLLQGFSDLDIVKIMYQSFGHEESYTRGVIKSIREKDRTYYSESDMDTLASPKHDKGAIHYVAIIRNFFVCAIFPGTTFGHLHMPVCNEAAMRLPAKKDQVDPFGKATGYLQNGDLPIKSKAAEKSFGEDYEACVSWFPELEGRRAV